MALWIQALDLAWRAGEAGKKRDLVTAVLRLSKIRLSIKHNNWTRMTHAVRLGVPRALRGNVWWALQPDSKDMNYVKESD